MFRRSSQGIDRKADRSFLREWIWWGIKAQTHASLTAMRGMLRYAALTGDTTLIPKGRDTLEIV